MKNYIVMIEDEVTIKIVRYDKDLLMLEPSNSKYDTRTFTHEQVQSLPVKIIGKVIYIRTDIL